MNFTDIVEQIRTDTGLSTEVPAFDPENGNEKAKYLLLLEAPGPKAVKTGYISFDNPDPSARNLREQLTASGFVRDEIAIWNVVPWYLGNNDATSIRPAMAADVRAGFQYLGLVVAAMPNLRCIVLVGHAARQAHMFLSKTTTARVVCCHHTSARVMNVNPEAAKGNKEIFRFVKATA